MKKTIVLLLTVLAVVVVFGLGAAFSTRAQAPSESAMAENFFQPQLKTFRAQALNERGDDGESAEAKFDGTAVHEEAMAMAAPSAPPAMSGVGGFGSGGGGADRGLAAVGSLGAKAKKSMAAAPDMSPSEPAQEAATRAWFPETFLFEPLIVTNAQGTASVPVKVPDRLTTWRILGLAHSRQGGQAGAVSSFLGTLPTYVDPVTPATLFAGDEVRLPMQVVNTTSAEVVSALSFRVSGPAGTALSSTGGSVRVAQDSSSVQYVTLNTKRPGAVKVLTKLGTTDAVERSIDVVPAGKRELTTHGGSLAAPRTFELEAPSNALPGSEQVRLQVFPGALGLVRSELSAAIGRGGVAEDAYLLQLLGRAPAVLKALGAQPEKDTIRDLTVLATQRVMQHARSPSIDSAIMLTEAALQHPENAVLSRLGERLAAQVATGQSPDGTCPAAQGWTLQRLLVSTGECVRAVRASTASPQAVQRATAVTVKASGAFERNLGRVTDGFTAASMLASGAVTGTSADKLKALVLAGIQEGSDGAKYLDVPSHVVRADGAAPSRYEATATAILALQGEKDAPLSDLGTYLLGGYNPAYGWGDGRANLACLRAVAELFKESVPAGVALTLERDGKVLAEGSIDAAKLQQVVTIDADATGSSGKHTWSVKANPAVPGLGFALTLVSYAPWRDERGGGLELTTKLPAALSVGQPADVELTAAMPANLATKLRLALPAGVQPDTASLDRLVSGRTVSRYETEDGAIILHVVPQRAGSVFTAKVRVMPTLSGRLQSAASQLGPDTRDTAGVKSFAPQTWAIR